MAIQEEEIQLLRFHYAADFIERNAALLLSDNQVSTQELSQALAKYKAENPQAFLEPIDIFDAALSNGLLRLALALTNPIEDITRERLLSETEPEQKAMFEGILSMIPNLRRKLRETLA